jgi:hypothetical protein
LAAAGIGGAIEAAFTGGTIEAAFTGAIEGPFTCASETLGGGMLFSRFLASGGGRALGRFVMAASLRSAVRAGVAERTSPFAVRADFFGSIPTCPPVRALVAPLVGQYHQALWV